MDSDLLTPRNKLVGNVCTHELVDERDVLAGLLVHLHRLDPADDATELARATRLLLVRVAEVGPLGNRLAEGDAGLPGRALDAVLPAHALDVDLEVEFTHSGNDGLAQK